MGGMGYAPPGFSKVLHYLWMPKGKTNETVAAAVDLLKEATREMWSIRCHRQQRAEEQERGITDDAKRDNGAASRWLAMPGHGRARRFRGAGVGAGAAHDREAE